MVPQLGELGEERVDVGALLADFLNEGERVVVVARLCDPFDVFEECFGDQWFRHGDHGL